jgi:hypothetical protein
MQTKGRQASGRSTAGPPSIGSAAEGVRSEIPHFRVMVLCGLVLFLDGFPALTAGARSIAPRRFVSPLRAYRFEPFATQSWRFVYLAFLTGEAFHFDWSEDWAITASK